MDARVLVLDEPSTALNGQELKRLFDLVKRLRRGGMGVVYVSRRPEELFAVAQRVTVLHGGRHMATRDMIDVTPDDLSRMMAGDPVPEERRMKEPVPGGRPFDIAGDPGLFG